MNAGQRAERADVISVLIVGAGLMGRWHCRTARKLGARVVGIVDADVKAADSLAREAHGAATADTVAKALTMAAPAIAHICTPTAAHFEAALALIESGVHVLVEKPFTKSAEQATALMEAARAAGVMACPVHQYAFQRGVAQAERWLRALGPPRQIHFDIRSAGADALASDRWAAIIDEILPHPISLLQRLLPGAPLPAIDWNIARSGVGEFMALAATGATTISISISLTARPTCFRTHVLTENGAIDIDGFHGFATLSRGRSATRATKLLTPFSESISVLSAASSNLVRRAIDGEPAYPGLAALTGAFYRAAVRSASAPISSEDIVAGMQAWERLRGVRAP